MYKIGFDNDKYLSMQSERIKERIAEFGGKLYLEFGGKLFDDYHASRVLPGFLPDSKLQMLLQLKDKAEIVVVISAEDIEKNKIRGDLGITYDVDVFRLIKAFEERGLFVGSVCLTKYTSTPKVKAFEEKLKNANINAYHLSQLYHENKRGIKAGYAKFETFPIWNIPLNHPVNIAYEAATADLNDVNMIDPWHLEAYGETTVNYNRDVEIFPVLKATFDKIYGKCPYKSPTDMGVNMAGNCIFDDEAVSNASKDEIIRRYFTAKRNKKHGAKNDNEIYKLELLLNNAGITSADRKCVAAAENLAHETDAPAAAIELADGRLITGKTSVLMGCASASMLNALKALAGIEDITLIDPEVIKPIEDLKTQHLGANNPQLHINEILIALSISAVTDKNAELALKQLDNLKHSEMHCSVMLSEVDEKVIKELGIRLTCNDR